MEEESKVPDVREEDLSAVAKLASATEVLPDQTVSVAAFNSSIGRGETGSPLTRGGFPF